MKITNPMMNAVFSSESTNAGTSAVICTLSRGARLLAARRGEEAQVALAGLVEHEGPQRLCASSYAWP